MENIENTKEFITEELANPQETKIIKKKKLKIISKWQHLSKKTKIIIIVISSIVLLGLIGLIIFLNQKPEKPKKQPKEEIVLNDNWQYKDNKLIFFDKNKKQIGTYKCNNKSADDCYVAYNEEDNLDGTKYIYEDETNLKTRTPLILNQYVFVFDNKNQEQSIITLYDFINDEKIENYTSVKKATNNDNDYIVKDTNGNYGLITITKEQIDTKLPFKYEYLGVYNKNSKTIENIIAKTNNKYYVMDMAEKKISTPTSSKIVSYNEQYVVTKDEKENYSAYDLEGHKVLQKNYSYVTAIKEYLAVIKDEKLYILDASETPLNDGIKLYNKYYNKTYIYALDDKLKEINNAFDITFEDSNIVINVIKDDENETYKINGLEGMFNAKSKYVSYIEGKLHFYSDELKTNEIGIYNCKNKNTITSADEQNLNCYIAKEINLTAAENEKYYAPIINNRYVFINDTLDVNTNTIVLYDLQDKKSLSNYTDIDTREHAKEITLIESEDLNVIAVSAKKGKYGMINIKSNEVKSKIPFENDNITSFNNLLLAKKSTGQYILYDENGTAITKELNNKIVDYDGNYIKTINNDKYQLFNVNAKEITKEYEDILITSSYIIGINNMKLDVLGSLGEVIKENIDIYQKDPQSAFNLENNILKIYDENSNIKEEINLKGEE